jgi:hypothetical protein
MKFIVNLQSLQTNIWFFLFIQFCFEKHQTSYTKISIRIQDFYTWIQPKNSLYRFNQKFVYFEYKNQLFGTYCSRDPSKHQTLSFLYRQRQINKVIQFPQIFTHPKIYKVRERIWISKTCTDARGKEKSHCPKYLKQKKMNQILFSS